jgi:uncharacterized protein (TIGR03086 family)
MDALGLLQQVVDETDKLVQNIDEGDLTSPTRCTEWTVRDLLNHVTGGATMFALSAEQGSVPDDLVGQLMGGDNLGDDFKSAWTAASRHALKAFEEPGVMDKMVTLPFGEMPGGVALNIAVFDVATHATDLAAATGQQVADSELLESALAIGRQMIGPELRQPGVFGPEQPCPDDAPVADRLAAFAGRQLG